MINAVGREIPDELLKDGREGYQGKFYMDGKYFKKAGPRVKRCEKPVDNKLCETIREACEKCNAHDGMTVSFHHALRNGDYVTSMVMKVLVEEMGLKDLTVATTSLGSAQDLLADYIVQGEGELIFNELLQCLVGGGAVPKHIAYREGEQVNLNGGITVIDDMSLLPFP